ncbi:MAG TPA: thiamine-phosphate kinase [Thermoanaerobaculia bacterium]|nr:thiamine-phosphate kinase [Thermoanaerobaculia bacterium]
MQVSVSEHGSPSVRGRATRAVRGAKQHLAGGSCYPARSGGSPPTAPEERKSARRETERTLVSWLAARPETAGLLGDDAAMLPPRSHHVVTVDFQIAGVHFPKGLDAAVLARRLLAVNLSDLAAMGARPVHAFLALAAPPGFAHRRFFSSLLREASRRGLTLAGGDLAAAAEVHASLNLIGERWPGARRWLRRSEARPGDAIYLGGTVGESALGLELVRRGARAGMRGVVLPRLPKLRANLDRAARRAVRRHLLPQAQLELGAWLSRRPRGAAIDVSDGVARDLHRLCAESAVGAVIEAERLPRAPGFASLAERLGLDPLALQLGGGEDYVLLFTLPEGAAPDARFGCRAVGRIESGRSVRVVDAEGRAAPLADLGWDHLAARAPGAADR